MSLIFECPTCGSNQRERLNEASYESLEFAKFNPVKKKPGFFYADIVVQCMGCERDRWFRVEFSISEVSFKKGLP